MLGRSVSVGQPAQNLIKPVQSFFQIFMQDLKKFFMPGKSAGLNLSQFGQDHYRGLHFPSENLVLDPLFRCGLKRNCQLLYVNGGLRLVFNDEFDGSFEFFRGHTYLHLRKAKDAASIPKKKAMPRSTLYGILSAIEPRSSLSAGMISTLPRDRMES